MLNKVLTKIKELGITIDYIQMDDNRHHHNNRHIIAIIPMVCAVFSFVGILLIAFK
ncbi:hypothetical protein RyT2_22580 [Pseudolactococcus yaeyamensis]